MPSDYIFCEQINHHQSWILSRIGRSNAIDSDENSDMKVSSTANELQAILVSKEKEKESDVCLLVDSPYRILRVSFSIKSIILMFDICSVFMLKLFCLIIFILKCFK